MEIKNNYKSISLKLNEEEAREFKKIIIDNDNISANKYIKSIIFNQENSYKEQLNVIEKKIRDIRNFSNIINKELLKFKQISANMWVRAIAQTSEEEPTKEDLTEAKTIYRNIEKYVENIINRQIEKT